MQKYEILKSHHDFQLTEYSQTELELGRAMTANKAPWYEVNLVKQVNSVQCVPPWFFGITDPETNNNWNNKFEFRYKAEKMEIYQQQ